MRQKAGRVSTLLSPSVGDQGLSRQHGRGEEEGSLSRWSLLRFTPGLGGDVSHTCAEAAFVTGSRVKEGERERGKEGALIRAGGRGDTPEPSSGLSNHTELHT